MPAFINRMMDHVTDRSPAPQPSPAFEIALAVVAGSSLLIPAQAIYSTTTLSFVDYSVIAALFLAIGSVAVHAGLYFTVKLSPSSIERMYVSWRRCPRLFRRTLRWNDVTSIEIQGILVVVHGAHCKIVINTAVYIRADQVDSYIRDSVERHSESHPQ